MAKRDTKQAKSTRKAKSPSRGGAAAAVRRPASAPRSGRTKAAASRPAPAVASTTGRDALPARLPRDPKGRRAQFYSDPAIDQLWAVVTSLTAEVSVAFDRLDTLERLLERDGRVTRASIEAYRPDESAAAERARRREELIQRVFQVLSQYGRG